MWVVIGIASVSTHSICFHGEIRPVSIMITPLFGDVTKPKTGVKDLYNYIQATNEIEISDH